MKFGFTLVTALLLATLAVLHAVDGASPAAWMPSAEDGTQLWWVEGAPKVFNSQVLPMEETLCFRYGGEKFLFDTKRVRPVDGAWECAVVADGRRYDCTGHGVVKRRVFSARLYGSRNKETRSAK
ncbi:MAG: hypothetical protein WCF18_00415 [Chthoniobacteraceae bacterium]